MNKEDAHIVVAMANHNMKVTDVARAIFAHRNTVLYHLDKVKR
jgi:DNA-binding PucR family transcriptional regulator